MVKLTVAVVAAAVCAAAWAVPATAPAREEDRDAIIEALLRRDRALRAVYFQVPVGLYRQYLEYLHVPPSPPAPFLAASGTYRLEVGKREVTLHAEVELAVLDAACPAVGVLGDLPQGWQEVTVNGREAHLPAVDGVLKFLPPESGRYVIAAKGRLGHPARRGRSLHLNVLRTARTVAAFDSPSTWEVVVDPGGQQRVGTDKGTHVRLPLPPLEGPLHLAYRPVTPQTARPPRFELSGQVAWNLDAGSQQVTTALDVTISGGPADHIELLLPAAADRLEITGPDVAQVSAQRGRAVVHLHGKVLGRTTLRVAYEMPVGEGSVALGAPGVADGHWTDGTLTVTNTAGASEVAPAETTGLEELALADLPAAHRAMLSGPAVLAYRITAREFHASVEVLRLGEFALRQSIADLAHYEVFAAADGAMLGRVRYEIRNHTGQFLRLTLPAGAQLLVARVNDQPCPVSGGQADGTWLLPLERSRASVMGLVSFPVEVVYLHRIAPLHEGKQVELPLPQIDLPVAYAWCQAYLPTGLVAKQWSGPMKRVQRLSSETAKASLDYGRAELAGMRKPTDADRDGSAAIRAVLARNYYRAGAYAYDRSDYAAAEDQLRQVLQLAPQSVEAENASRLLANAQLLRGQLAPRSTGEKAAAAQVQREVAESNRPLSEQQAELYSEAIEAGRAGKVQEAAAKFKVAEELKEKLSQRGVSKKELAARSRQVQQEAQQVQEALQAKSSDLRQQMSELRQAGRYDEALEVGRTVRDLEGDAPQLRAEMEELALAASRRQQELQSRVAQAPAAAPVQPATGEPAAAGFDVRDLLAAAPTTEPTAQPPREGTDADRLLSLVKQNVDPQSWETPGRDIRIIDGVLVADTTATNRKAIGDLLARLRQARGPAVAIGGRIAAQRAKGLAISGPSPRFLSPDAIQSRYVTAPAGAPVADTKELRRFIVENYDWQTARRAPQPTTQPGEPPAVQATGGGLDVSGLADRLESNLGQKVTVDSFNVSASASQAEALGVSFTLGRNDLAWAVVDEAQVRSLIDLAEASAAGGERSAVSPARRQETIVGTDALLANGMTANEAFAAERHNGLVIADNGILLPHDRYLVIQSGPGLTIVRAGAMQYWTERAEPVELAPVPQSIEVPRVGQLVQFEKTLLDPADRLVLRAQTTWKGVAP